MASVELVVKIPEEAYKKLKNEGVDWLGAEHILDAVANGIPLPKGHGDLVDYEELKNNAREYGAYAEATLSHIKPKTIIEADRSVKK